MSANLALLHKLQDLDVEYKYASEWPDTDLQEVRRLANRRTERQELADNVYSMGRTPQWVRAVMRIAHD